MGLRFLFSFSLLYMSLYCGRLNLSYAAPAMMQGLHLSSGEIGLVTSLLFWTYAIGGVINGAASEKLGASRLIVASALLSAAVNLIFSFQSSLLVMAVLWTLNGFFQSMAWAPGIAALTGWFPENRRGFATGFANAFSGFGQAAAALAVSLSFRLAPELGWRSAFRLPLLLIFGLLLLFLLLAREPETEQTSDAERKVESSGIGKLLAGRSFRVWVLIAFLTGLTRYGLIVWIPLYFSERFGVNVTDGLLQSLALPIGMGVGAFVLPTLTDRLCPGNRLHAVAIPAFLGALSIAAFLLLKPDSLAGLLLISLFLFAAGFCVYAINGTAWAYAADIGGERHSGVCTGLLNLASYVGAAVQSVVYGFLLSHIGWSAVYGSLAAFCAMIGLLSFRENSRNRNK